MTRLALCLAVAAAAGGGCKEAGTATITVSLPDQCTIADEEMPLARFVALLLPEGRCGDCSCEDCSVDICDAGTCHEAACSSGVEPPCPLADLDDGLRIDSAPPGAYAIVLRFYSADTRRTEPIALACEELLLDRDGTSDLSLMPVAGCCEGERTDAGF